MKTIAVLLIVTAAALAESNPLVVAPLSDYDATRVTSAAALGRQNAE